MIRVKRVKIVYRSSQKPVSELPAIWDNTVLPATRHRWTSLNYRSRMELTSSWSRVRRSVVTPPHRWY